MKVGRITEFLPGEIKRARKSDRVVAAVLAYWREIGLEQLEAIERIEYTRGDIVLHVSSAAARYILDRRFREPEVLRGTIGRAPGTIRRIRTRT